jgi:hypothetical protein
MITANILGLYWNYGKINPADIIKKHWGYHQVKQKRQTLLFYPGNTGDLQ